MKIAATLGLTAVLVAQAVAQDVPLQRPEERQATRQQSQEIFDVIKPLAREVSKSTVWIWANRRQVAMGTVVGDGSQVLTKWSEIALARTPIQAVGGDGRTATASILGVYRDEDLALLQLTGEKFKPVTWSEGETPGIGRFLVAPGPDDNPLGLGVVAVAERPLRESDQAFIGISLDPEFEGDGVRIREVDDRGGADEAGVLAGDVLTAIGEREITSAFELRNILLDYSPGDEITAKLQRDGKPLEVQITLGGRPEFPGVPESRLRLMRQMGGPISLVGSGFPLALQTDMQLKPQQCGGPVIGLDGEVVGVTVARTDRTRSFVIPASQIQLMLGQNPVSPAMAQLPTETERVPGGGADRPRRQAVPMNPRAAGRLRRHLEEMSELLERMEREMEEVGEE
ncbi:serine protease [Haloferula helveola]|uniref:Serine protease n=1 Tax=Haloferula helveola TaxID=490095 RepID=A0ABM7RJ92_9BACT|nr:serine protease [Haloferula helveola]